GVDGDPPARDRDPRLPGRDELARDAAAAGLAVELERHRHLSDRAVGADREYDLRRVRQVLARRHVQARRRFAQVTQLDAEAPRQLGELRAAGDELAQTALQVEPLRAPVLQELAP